MQCTENRQIELTKADGLSPLQKGYIVMAGVLFIWSSFVLSIRGIGASPLTVADVALLRFSVPMLILLPYVRSRLAVIKKVKVSDILLLLLGGLPFLLLVSLGAASAPSAYVSTIVTSTPPFFVAVISYLFYRQKVSLKQTFTLCLIVIGVMIMITGGRAHISSEMITGVCFLLAAGGIWACYTIGLKRAGLDAISLAIITSYLSFFITFILVVFGGLKSNVGLFSLQQALPFILVQGIGVGILATIGFSYAVNKLGPANASVMGALSPGLTSLLAVPIYNESLSLIIIGGISITITGVIFSSRV